MSSLFHDLVSPAVVRALGWTLLHALWQGALVALLLRGGLLAARRAAASSRYVLSAGALALLLILAVSTFVSSYEPPRFHSMAQVTVLTLRDVATTSPAYIPTTDELLTPVPDWRDRLELTVRTTAAQLEPWLPVLVAVWALGLALMLVRLGGGLLVVRRLRRVGVVAVPARWQETATTLAQLMGIRRAVELLESGTIGGLVAVGWLKPVVLLPVGLVNGLPVAQLEAILAHELAHIRRHDYLLNLLQSVIEALFFFHPAVWWMSAQVRLEREHCCDDLAVDALGGDARTLARALAALATWQAETAGAFAAAPLLPRLTLAATGGALLTRVRRLLVPTPEEATRPAGALAGGSAALALLLVLTINALLRAPLPAQAARLPKLVREVLPVTLPVQEPVEEPTAQVCAVADTTTRRAGKPAPNLIIVKDKKNRLKEVYVDGKKVPKDRLDDYAELVDDALKAPASHPRAEVASETDMAAARRSLRAAEREARRAGDHRSHHLVVSNDLAILDGQAVRLDSLGQYLDRTLSRAFGNLDLSNFNLSISDGDDAHFRIESFPTPPVPPVAPVAPVVPAVPALPALPKAPKANDAKARQRYQRQMNEYRQRMDAYGRAMEAYGRQMEEYQRQLQARPGAGLGAPLKSWKRGSDVYVYQNGSDGQWLRADSQSREAQRETERARREAAREQREARREAERDRAEALREAEENRREALREAVEARREALEAQREALEEVRREGRFSQGSLPTPPSPPDPPHFESNQIGEALRRDGLIDQDARRYSLSYEKGVLRINGKEQPTEVREKYRKLLDIPANDRGRSLQIEINED